MLTLLLSGCLVNDDLYREARARLLASDSAADSATDTANVDADGDGSPAGEDCDDDDAHAYPGASETCDGVDEDCDGEIDVDATDGTTVWPDADGDGWGDADGAASVRCLPAVGWSATAGDCDDARARVYPDAPERLDGVRNDCADGRADALTVALADAILEGEDAEDGFGRGIVPGPDLNGDGVGGLIVGALPNGRAEVRLLDDVLDLRSLETVSRIGGWDGDTAPTWGAFGLERDEVLWLPRTADVARMVADGRGNEVLGTLPVRATALARRMTPSGAGELFVGIAGEVYRLEDPDASWSAAVALGGATGVTRLDAGGDVDGDGYDDVLVGMPDADRVLVVSGDALRGTAPLATLVGVAGEGAGTRVRVLGDLDADGRAEVGVGAPFSDAVRRDAGRIYVVEGVGAVGTVTLEGGSAWGVGGQGVDVFIGMSFSNCASNTSPLVVGVPSFDADSGNIEDAGGVFLFQSSSSIVTLPDATSSVVGNNAASRFGEHVECIDISGDGVDDVIASSDISRFGRIMSFLVNN